MCRGGKIALLVSLLLFLAVFAEPSAIARVEEENLELSSNPVIITTSGDAYYLQVGIFSVDRNAEFLKSTLDKNGMPVIVETFENKRGELFKKVLVGPFYSGSEAERDMDRIREITGLDPLLIRRGQDYEAPERVAAPPLESTETPESEKADVEEVAKPEQLEEEDFSITERLVVPDEPESRDVAAPQPEAMEEPGKMATAEPETPISKQMEEEEYSISEQTVVPEEPEPQIAGTRKPKIMEKLLPGSTTEPEPATPVKPEAEEGVEKKPVPPSKPVESIAEKVKPVPAKKSGPKISLDFTDVDISVLIKFISEVTGKNFIYDEKVRGNITIVSPKKISKEEMYQVFLSVLQVKGFTTVEQGNVVKIIPSRDAKQEGLKTFIRKDYKVTDEFITQLIPLKYIDVKDASPLLTPLISKEGLLTFYGPSNTLIIIDRGSNISRIADILAELDVGTAAQIIKMHQLQHATSDEVANILSQLYTTSGKPVATRQVRGRQPKGAQPAVVATASGEAKFISDSRTNNLIVLAPSELIEEIGEMIVKLDIPTPENVGKINVYYLENADAEELAAVLNSLISGRQVGGRQPQPGQPSTIKGIIAPEFEGPIKITADKATNSLLVIASPGDYLTLVEVIKKLDIKRRQVYVEAIIMEIKLDDTRELGVEWRAAFEPTDSSAAIAGSNFTFTGNVNDLLAALAAGNPLLLAGEGLTTGVIGGSVILPDGTEIPAITAILRAAQVSTNVNVLATPHLLTTDNEEAEIIVGEEVPFITSQARDTTNLANIINTVEREDVGITLRLTPQIHESEFVKLAIYEEISSLEETPLIEAAAIGRTTSKRSAETNIIVKSGQTIVLGGLMQDRVNRRVSKIPILGDIPILGALFRFTSNTSEKTNLLLFLTPRIIKDTSELEGVTLKMKESMKDFIERNTKEIRGLDFEEYNKSLDPFAIETDGP